MIWQSRIENKLKGTFEQWSWQVGWFQPENRLKKRKTNLILYAFQTIGSYAVVELHKLIWNLCISYHWTIKLKKTFEHPVVGLPPHKSKIISELLLLGCLYICAKQKSFPLQNNKEAGEPLIMRKLQDILHNRENGAVFLYEVVGKFKTRGMLSKFVWTELSLK